jgi:hypothetical protein
LLRYILFFLHSLVAVSQRGNSNHEIVNQTGDEIEIETRSNDTRAPKKKTHIDEKIRVSVRKLINLRARNVLSGSSYITPLDRGYEVEKKQNKHFGVKPGCWYAEHAIVYQFRFHFERAIPRRKKIQFWRFYVEKVIKCL